MKGVVTSINAERGFGFIRSAEHSRIFFHVTEIADQAALPFDDQLVERRVTFETTNTDRGVRAHYIQPAE